MPFFHENRPFPMETQPKKLHQYPIYLFQSCRGAVAIKNTPLKLILKRKSHGILFAHNPIISCPIILQFCTEHGSNTAVLCVKFQNHWATDMDALDEQTFMKFQF